MPDNSLLTALTRELHVWIAIPEKIASSGDQWLLLLNEEEVRQYERFRFSRDRLIYLAAHLLLRTTLSRYDSCLPGQWQFIRGLNGKPRIDPACCTAPLTFNLSHTRGMVACVVSLERECGVDVEGIRQLAGWPEIASMVFSGDEIAFINSRPSSDQATAFLSLWTLKESFVKATGMGLAAPLKEISFHIAQNITTHFDSGYRGDPAAWLFHLFRPSPVHLLAVAASPGTGLESVIYREVLDIDDKHGGFVDLQRVSFK